MAVKISVDDKKFQRALKNFYAGTQKDRAEILKAQGRLIAVNLAFQTAPFGSDKGAKLKGETSVRADVNRVYKGVPVTHRDIWNSGKGQSLPYIEDSRQAAAAFVRMMRSGDFISAEKLLEDLGLPRYRGTEVGMFDGGQAIRAARYGRRKKVSRNQFAEQVVKNQPALNRFSKMVMKRVGLAKAGWASPAKYLGGTRGIPSWVTRHTDGRALGSIDDQTSRRSRPYIKMTNHVPYVSNCLSPAQIGRALDIQRQKMIRAINIAASKRAKASGL